MLLFNLYIIFKTSDYVDVLLCTFVFADMLNLTNILNNNNPLQDINFIFGVMLNVSRNILHNENVERLIDGPKQHFDLVIGEWMFTSLYCG